MPESFLLFLVFSKRPCILAKLVPLCTYIAYLRRWCLTRSYVVFCLLNIYFLLHRLWTWFLLAFQIEENIQTNISCFSMQADKNLIIAAVSTGTIQIQLESIVHATSMLANIFEESIWLERCSRVGGWNDSLAVNKDLLDFLGCESRAFWPCCSFLSRSSSRHAYNVIPMAALVSIQFNVPSQKLNQCVQYQVEVSITKAGSRAFDVHYCRWSTAVFFKLSTTSSILLTTREIFHVH